MIDSSLPATSLSRCAALVFLASVSVLIVARPASALEAAHCPKPPVDRSVVCSSVPVADMLGRAKLAFESGRYREAQSMAQCLSRVKVTPEFRKQRIEALHLLGRAARHTGDYHLAEVALRNALKDSQDDVSLTGKTYIFLGALHERQKLHDQALGDYTTALALMKDETRDWRNIMIVKFQIGDLAISMGQFDRGIGAYSDAFNVADKLRTGDDAALATQRVLARAMAYDYLGYANRKLGNFDEALRNHGLALDALDTLKAIDLSVELDVERRMARARTRNHFGLVYQARAMSRPGSERQEAIEGLRGGIAQEGEAVRELLPADDQPPLSLSRWGYALRARASIYVDLAEFQTAPEQRQERQDLFKAAERAAQEALTSARGQQMGDVEWMGLARHWLARSKAGQGRYAEAEAELDCAIEVWRSTKDYYSWGHAYLLHAERISVPTRNFADARKFFALAAEMFRKRPWPDELVRTYVARGLMFELTGDFDAARRSYVDAIEIVEQIRTDVSGEDNRITMFARRQAPYEALINLLLRAPRQRSAAETTGEALRISECARSRTLVDRLAAAAEAPGASNKSADGRMNPSSLGSCITGRAAAAQVGASLAPGDVALEYYIGATASYLFVVRPGYGPEVVRLDCPPSEKNIDFPCRDALRAEITAEINRFRRPFEEMRLALQRHAESKAKDQELSAKGMTFDIGVAKKLFDQLLRPAMPYLEGAKRIVVVPHGPLFFAPFEAFVKQAPADGQDIFTTLKTTTFALDALPAPIVYAYSLAAVSKRPQAAVLATQDVLAYLDPVTDLQSLQALRNDGVWLQRLGRTTIRSGPQATWASFNREAGHHANILVISHALANLRDPAHSGFWLSDEKDPKGTLVTAKHIAGLRLKADLVTIRACETGLGPVIDGEGITGLTQAFKQAGARNLVLSLWIAHNASSSEMIGQFYKSFGQDGYANGLQQAKVKFIKRAQDATPSSEMSYRIHPFFWAPFILFI